MVYQQLSELLLRSVSGGVTPSTLPFITDEYLGRAHRTPSVSCGPPLWSLSRPPWREPFVSPLTWITERHDTYTFAYYHSHLHKVIYITFILRLEA